MMRRIAGFAMLCGFLAAAQPMTVLAASGSAAAGVSYIATVTAEQVNINKSMESEEVLLTAENGSSYEVLEDLGNGWVKVQAGDQEGYLPASGNAALEQVSSEELEAIRLEAAAEAVASIGRREQLVSYALQFLGGPYRYGGSDPRTGTDCSGFTSFVYRNGIGVSISRSSTGQASQGTPIGAEQMQPGDLIFYGSGRSINHVAMYIGNGQVVHASTPQTGIKTSAWNYRTPVKIVNILG